MVRTKPSLSRRRVLFKRRAMASPADSSNDRVKSSIKSSMDEEIIQEIPLRAHLKMIPDLFTQPPPVRDSLETPTSTAQDKTVEKCQPFLSGEDENSEYNEHGVPRLFREKHVAFLRNNLKGLPGRFVAADASRPWFLYWCLEGLATLGEDLSSYREAVAATARSMQNESGGFGGGGRQLSHLAPTYAVILSLALVGGEDVFQVVDRKAMWKWLCSLKQPDGGFQLCLGGEEDVRGAFCATVVITLLNLPLDLTTDSPAYDPNKPGNLLTGVGDYIHHCQTFEGGISAQPDSEAHGAYAFCALGALSILDAPGSTIPKYLDVPRLISWLSSRQYAPEGGFSGRTNKLVDGCYSHWVGACFPLIEAALSDPRRTDSKKFPAVSESLFHREGLIRYILCCGQDQTRRGGLRDKPGMMSDAYHTCYVLSGLSSAQHQWRLTSTDNSSTTDGETMQWSVTPYPEDTQIFEHDDKVGPVHPIYAIPQEKQEAARDYFLSREVF